MDVPKKINERLNKIIGNDEKLICCVNDTSPKYRNSISFGKTLYIFLTNKKIVFLDKGIFNIEEQITMLEKIDTIAQKKKILSSDIYIYTGSTQTILANVEKQQAETFIQKVNEEIENYKTFSIQVNKTVEQDITDKIGKLAELHREGVLTDYEFSTKKMELLEKLKK